MRRPRQALAIDGYLKHPLQRGEFAIDRGIRGPFPPRVFLLALGYVRDDPVCCYIDGAIEAEEPAELLDAGVGSPQRSQAID